VSVITTFKEINVFEIKKKLGEFIPVFSSFTSSRDLNLPVQTSETPTETSFKYILHIFSILVCLYYSLG
jgi:hypothetical protein